MIRTIPLNKLMPSRRNVRRTTDEQAEVQLKAEIEARGLPSELGGCPGEEAEVRFTVEAGGGASGRSPVSSKKEKLRVDHAVCCLVIDGGPAAARDAELAENFQRPAMNPADECLAFQQLIEQSADVERIAQRFGLTVRFVEGWLQLAGLAPIVFERSAPGRSL
jgi:ParB family transcriptional regulator, chromosome partitioning protein